MLSAAYLIFMECRKSKSTLKVVCDCHLAPKLENKLYCPNSSKGMSIKCRIKVEISHLSKISS